MNFNLALNKFRFEWKSFNAFNTFVISSTSVFVWQNQRVNILATWPRVAIVKRLRNYQVSIYCICYIINFLIPPTTTTCDIETCVFINDDKTLCPSNILNAFSDKKITSWHFYLLTSLNWIFSVIIINAIINVKSSLTVQHINCQLGCKDDVLVCTDLGLRICKYLINIEFKKMNCHEDSWTFLRVYIIVNNV